MDPARHYRDVHRTPPDYQTIIKFLVVACILDSVLFDEPSTTTPSAALRRGPLLRGILVDGEDPATAGAEPQQAADLTGRGDRISIDSPLTAKANLLVAVAVRCRRRESWDERFRRQPDGKLSHLCSESHDPDIDGPRTTMTTMISSAANRSGVVGKTESTPWKARMMMATTRTPCFLNGHLLLVVVLATAALSLLLSPRAIEHAYSAFLRC